MNNFILTRFDYKSAELDAWPFDSEKEALRELARQAVEDCDDKPFPQDRPLTKDNLSQWIEADGVLWNIHDFS